VASLPDISQNTQTWPTTSAMNSKLENTVKKSIGTKANNSIDVHRLQKNIDNWTIQVCRSLLNFNEYYFVYKAYTLYIIIYSRENLSFPTTNIFSVVPLIFFVI